MLFRFFVAVPVILSGAGCAVRVCQSPIPRDGATLEIAGVLQKAEVWGPPYFGEHPQTDSRFTAWFIDVPTPLRIAGGARFGFTVWPTVSRIQVRLVHSFSEDAILSPYDGKLVVATGKLFHATVASDITPETLDADHVGPADHPACRVLSGG